MNDETEPFRRQRIAKIHSEIKSFDKDVERQRLKKKYGEVWDTTQLSMNFKVIAFAAPFVIVERLSDGKKGSLEFQHHPRFYFNFQEA